MFTKIATPEVITDNSKTVMVEICKFKKNGSSREFFAPEIGGKRLTRTMFARKYDAIRLAKEYIATKKN